ncbi:MAG: hypothetical protein ACJAVV_000406 [Alphaproteobacteria bacterium]|jgi:hypothetical protein
MAVYHRTYTRAPLALDVELQFKGEKMCHTFTRNINRFGAFIELSKPNLVTNDFVKIYFTSKDDNHTCVTQKGMVMHRCKEGVGILFASDTKEFRTMLDLEMTTVGKMNHVPELFKNH